MVLVEREEELAVTRFSISNQENPAQKRHLCVIQRKNF